MSIKIAINGFGRIGRSVFRNILQMQDTDISVVAINDLSDGETLAHLLQYDSVYGNLMEEVVCNNRELEIGGGFPKTKLYAEKDPGNLPWKELGVDVVLECTGLFRDYDGAKKHLNAGAKKVIISAPSKSPEKIQSFVLGVNEEKYNSEEHHIVDMGSCTTNCLAPVAKIVHREYGIQSGMMTTVHSYTMDQNLLDGSHRDLRRSRAAALNIIPTTTGAAKAVERVVPELDGKINGIALRVPTATVSVVDFVCLISRDAGKEDVKNLLEAESQGEKLKGILKVETAPLVSSDYIGSSYSSIVDVEMIDVKDNMLKILAWYDNEWAYSRRLVDFAKYITRR